MTSPDLHLRETLGKPELLPFLHRLRKRLERGQALSGTIVLNHLQPHERSVLLRLLGKPPSRSQSLSVDLTQLEKRLVEAGACISLAHAVEKLLGPVVNRNEARRSEAAQWEALFEDALAKMPLPPGHLPWVDQLRRRGLLRHYGLEQARILFPQALAIAAQLPSQSVTLAELAAATLGNAHALDSGQPLSALVIRLAATLGGVERWDDAASRREAWATLGVLLDDLSAPVLTLNLRASSPSSISRVLQLWADIGEPCHLTLRQLRTMPPVFSPATTGQRVFVCENPNIVSAAARSLGPRSAPLICTEGQPKTALHELLGHLCKAGIQLYYHGDFDWPGIRMANAFIARYEACPWRMSAADYLREASLDFPLTGEPAPALWDADLASAMQNLGKAVHEEQVTEHLLSDLA